MTYADSTERAALICGFRGLADYLESNPEVPAPAYPTVYAFPSSGDWAEMRADIDAIAALLGVTRRHHRRRPLRRRPVLRAGRVPRGRHPAGSDSQESE